MRRLMRMLAALLLGFGWLMVVPGSAQAAGADWRIDNYDVIAKVDAGGTTTVQLNIDFDFGTEAGHGPYLVLPLRQIAEDENYWRMLDYTVGAVTSPSGADTKTVTEESNGNLVIRVGDDAMTYTGVQTYQINYTVRGLIAPNQKQDNKDYSLDEFNWQVVGPGWEVPIGAVSVQFSGPAKISQVACLYDDKSVCTSLADGAGASFVAKNVGKGAGVQVVAGYPVGTFVGAEARLTKRVWLGNMFLVDGLTVGVTAVLVVAGFYVLFRRTRRAARDQVYLGLTPGVTPAPGSEATIGHDYVDSPVAVAFTPPPGVRPGEIGTLIDATADERDITATLTDLAVRNHLSIEQGGRRDFTFTLKDNPNDELIGYEEALLSRLFVEGNQVSTDDLRDQSYSGMLSETRSDMYSRVTNELRWFQQNPALVRGGAIAAGIVLVVVGIGLGWLLGQVGWGLVGLAPILIGIGVLIMNNKFGRRTAEGSAVLAQAKGFELYLTTAEAEQIKFEEGIDVFSRYLPYAMVFGVADRWTKVFEQLASEGRYDFNPYWYVGYGYGFGLGSLSSSLDSLGATMGSSLQAATAATSGGSGFSGGGGFGGGGGGGW
jgi:hypothetical protein